MQPVEGVVSLPVLHSIANSEEALLQGVSQYN